MLPRLLQALLLVCAFLPAPSSAQKSAEELFGLQFTDKERELMQRNLENARTNFFRLRALELPNEVAPALQFNPRPSGFKISPAKAIKGWKYPAVGKSISEADLAFASVAELGALLRARKVTSEQLTRLSIKRLKEHGPELECVVTLTEELALEQARRADEEIRRGKFRGPLHGIPYGAKDLLATKGIRTTWGAPPFTNQVFKYNARVIEKLEEAGAVLVAKLTLGEIAMGDTWFGGKTRNPWDTKQGSSGSSAGSAAATSAGLVPFAMGSETYGSIISPSTVCGVTGLRPTFGRVSRAGAMTLSWSMDKLGPIGRTAEDCALVLDAIKGIDEKDAATFEAPYFVPKPLELKKLRIGYLHKEFSRSTRESDAQALELFRKGGAELVPIEMPALPVNAMQLVLGVEAGAAFQQLILSGQDDTLVQQGRGAWPNILRAAQLVPAVEYIQANRARTLLCLEIDKIFKEVDLVIHPTWEGTTLLVGNLTGHPAISLPSGFNKEGLPHSITLMGRLYGESDLLAAAMAYQKATHHHLRRPPQFNGK